MEAEVGEVLGNAMAVLEENVEHGVVSEDEYKRFCDLAKKVYEGRRVRRVTETRVSVRTAAASGVGALVSAVKKRVCTRDFEPCRVLATVADGLRKSWEEGKRDFAA